MMASSVRIFFLLLSWPCLIHAQDTLPAIEFTPGRHVLFQDDFSKQPIGEFPKGWTTNGDGFVDTTLLARGRWMKITTSGITCPADTITLGDTYTIEFDVIPKKDPYKYNSHSYGFTIISTRKPKDLTYGMSRPGDAGIKFDFGPANYYFAYFDDGTLPLKGSNTGNKALSKQEPDRPYRMRISVQQQRIIVYRDNEKLFDLPTAMSLNYSYNMVRFENGTPMFTNFRVGR